jgi:arabinofuranosyltransferase
VRGRTLAVAAPIAALTLAIGVFLLKTRQLAGILGAEAFPLDDSWIHMQFARNLAEGRGFSYNPGVPVSGSTAPLWTLVLGGVFAVFGSHPVLAKVLGIAATLGTAGLAGRLALTWAGRHDVALLASVLVALAGPMVWGALSGMEVALAALLVTAVFVLHARGRAWAAGAVLGLAALARPETALLLPLFWLAGPLTGRRALAWGLPVAGFLSAWVAFNLAATGSPLPATAAAKIEGGLLGYLAGVREPLRTALLGRPWQFEAEWAFWLWRVDVLLPFLLLPGLWWLGRHVGRAALAPASVLLLHPLAMAMLAPYRAPSFQEGRYSIHLLPLALVVALVPVTPLFSFPLSPRGGEAGVRGLRWMRGLGWARGRVGWIASLALLIGAVAALPSAATRYGWAVQNIEAMQVHLGHWVARHTPPTARIGLNDVGAIAYISRREVVDVMGLVTPAIIPFRRDGEMGVLRYLEQACPDYLIVFPAWFPTLSGMAERFHPVYRVRLAHNEVAGADELVVYETAWSRWRADRRPCPGALARVPGTPREASVEIPGNRIIASRYR